MKRALFIDRDGTILVEPADEQIDSYEKFQFVPGVIGALKFLCEHTDYEFVMVSNQDGLGTDSYPEDDFWPTQNLMLDILKGEGVVFDAIHIDRSFPFVQRVNATKHLAIFALCALFNTIINVSCFVLRIKGGIRLNV